MQKKRIQILLLLYTLCLFDHHSISREADEDVVPEIPIGNFALPGPNRPFPMLGIGQTVVDKHNIFGFFEVDNFYGPHHTSTIINPQFLYGINNSCSLFIEMPAFAQLKESSKKSSGISDLSAQIEYDYFCKNKPSSSLTGSILASVSFPTGNHKKDPATGTGGTSLFFGTTLVYMATDWYSFTSYGASVPLKKAHKNGALHSFTYQAGVGKNISYKTDKWLFTWIIELSGTYEKGSNAILLCPSLWYSTHTLLLQFGIAPVIYDYEWNKLNKTKLFTTFSLGLKFH